MPSDHIVAATGVLSNVSKILTPVQLKRLAEAKKSDEPVFIVTPEEALEAEKSKFQPQELEKGFSYANLAMLAALIPIIFILINYLVL